MYIDKENISRLLLMDNDFIGRVIRALNDDLCCEDSGVMYAVKLIKTEQEKREERKQEISKKRRAAALKRLKNGKL